MVLFQFEHDLQARWHEEQRLRRLRRERDRPPHSKSQFDNDPNAQRFEEWFARSYERRRTRTAFGGMGLFGDLVRVVVVYMPVLVFTLYIYEVTRYEEEVKEAERNMTDEERRKRWFENELKRVR